MNPELNIRGLKCDNTNCDYVDPDVPFEKYTSYIGFPCPKCGQSLLTQETHDKVVKMMEEYQRFKAVIRDFPDHGDGKDLVELKFYFDSTPEGDITGISPR